jgi:hypothetical protein
MGGEWRIRVGPVSIDQIKIFFLMGILRRVFYAGF